MTSQTDHQLDLVRSALDQFDDLPLPVIVRKVVRIASLLGESELAVRLGLEVKPSRGHPPTNAAESRRLMLDDLDDQTANEVVENALTVYMANRAIGDGSGKLAGHSLVDIDDVLVAIERDREAGVVTQESLELHVLMRGIQENARHACFTALVSWERRLGYGSVNERIFEAFRGRVDRLLAEIAPDVVPQFTAVYRRLDDAGRLTDAESAEELAQAVATCRRILKTVADHVLSGEPGAISEDGHILDEERYKNRVTEFVKQQTGSKSSAVALESEFGGLLDRFARLNDLSSKGVHANIARYEADLCAMGTYVIAADLLGLLEYSADGS
jgi:hypothetical protein